VDRLGDDIRRELGRFGPQGALGDILAAWSAAVGETIARNACPARVARDGTLHVAVSSSAWAFELTQLAPTIVERLRSALGAGCPPALRFAPGPLPQTAAPGGLVAQSHKVEPEAEERAAAAALVAGIDDDALRSLVARAAAASLARTRANRGV
jgi:hypothetical protein